MQEQWKRIENRLKALGCLDEMALLPGASQAEIEALEKHVGVVLPQAFKQFLGIHNGQDGFGLIQGVALLSIAGMREQWDNWRAIDEDDMNEDCAEFMASEPEGVVKPMYCNPAWIPFTHDGGGNHIGFDFDPDRSGTSGQIIAFGRDEDVKRLLAASFESFLEDCIAWLERAEWNGRYLDVAHEA